MSISKETRSESHTVGSRHTGPTLGITDGSGKLDLMAIVTVFAVMCHPEDDKSRREFVAVHRAGIVSGYLSKALKDLDLSPDSEGVDIFREAIEEEVTWYPTMLEDVLSAPSTEGALQRAVASNFGGAVAGDVLKFILRCAVHCPEHASVRKAIHVITRSLAGARDCNGRQVNSSRSSVSRAWSRFRPVAHLWAAFRIWEIDLEKDPEWALTPDNLLWFLAVAEEFRRRGVGFLVPRAQAMEHGPILDPATTWRIPQDLELASIPLEADPLPRQILEDLEAYRARR